MPKRFFIIILKYFMLTNALAYFPGTLVVKKEVLKV